MNMSIIFSTVSKCLVPGVGGGGGPPEDHLHARGGTRGGGLHQAYPGGPGTHVGEVYTRYTRGGGQHQAHTGGPGIVGHR